MPYSILKKSLNRISDCRPSYKKYITVQKHPNIQDMETLGEAILVY